MPSVLVLGLLALSSISCRFPAYCVWQESDLRRLPFSDSCMCQHPAGSLVEDGKVAERKLYPACASVCACVWEVPQFVQWLSAYWTGCGSSSCCVMPTIPTHCPPSLSPGGSRSFLKLLIRVASFCLVSLLFNHLCNKIPMFKSLFLKISNAFCYQVRPRTSFLLLCTHLLKFNSLKEHPVIISEFQVKIPCGLNWASCLRFREAETEVPLAGAGLLSGHSGEASAPASPVVGRIHLLTVTVLHFLACCQLGAALSLCFSYYLAFPSQQ